MSGTYTWPQVVNGKTYTEADFRPYTYATTLPDLLGNFTAQAVSAQAVVQAANASASAAAAASSATAAAASSATAANATANAVAAQGAAQVANASASAAQAASSAAQAASLVAGVTTGSTANLIYPEQVRNLVTASDVSDVFVYDTRLDSDGGAWTERCSGTAWHQEALNTSTRGAKRAFPKLALLVLRSGAAAAPALSIYDALDLDANGAPRFWASMDARWAPFTTATTINVPSSVFALNGNIWVTLAGTSGRFVHINLPAATIAVQGIAAPFMLSGFSFAAQNANTLVTNSIASIGLASRDCNAAHARVLPGAPLGAASGLPIPTVAVATASGISVIHPTGLVASLTNTGMKVVSFVSDTHLGGIQSTDANAILYYLIPYATAAESGLRVALYYFSGGGNLNYISGGHSSLIAGAAGAAQGLVQFADQLATSPANGMVAQTALTYATGWQPGDIRLATLCDSAVGAITSATTVTDRSYRAVSLNVVGTLSRAAVGTGNDVVAFSGFSASDYLEQPYNSLLDFGTGDFCIAAWANVAAINSTKHLVYRRLGTTGPLFMLREFGSGPTMQVSVGDGTTATAVGSGANYTLGTWTQVIATRRAGVLELWVNGALAGSAAATQNLTSVDSPLRIGAGDSGAFPFTNSSLALLRISAYAPTPTQIARMYRDEAPLFDVGAKAFLGGTTSAVNDLAFSENSRILAVATTGGVSIYSGLRRVEYLSTGNLSPAMAANNTSRIALESGALMVGTTANAGVRRDAITGLDRMLTAPRAPFSPRMLTARGFTTDATPLSLAPRLFIGERETMIVQATIVGRVFGASDGQRLSYQRRATYYRDAAGNVTLQGSVQTIGTDTEVTGTADATLLIDTTAQTVTPQVTGVAATRIVWTARLEVTRISDAQYEEIV